MRLKLFFDQPIAQVILHDPYETPLGLPCPMETPTDHHKFGASTPTFGHLPLWLE